MDYHDVITRLGRESGSVEVLFGGRVEFYFPELENKSQQSFPSPFETSSRKEI